MSSQGHSMIFEMSWQPGEVPEDWKKANVTPIFGKGKKEDLQNYKYVSLMSIPGKVMKHILWEAISKNTKEKKMNGSRQVGFTKGKSSLNNLIAFYKEMTSLVKDGRAVDVIYLDVSKAFNTVSHNIRIDKLIKYGLHKWTVRTEN